MNNLNPATEKQVAFLIQLGFDSDIASTLTVSQARQAIHCKLNEVSVKQRHFLLKHGVPETTIATLSKAEAHSMIGAILEKKRNARDEENNPFGFKADYLPRF